MTTPNTPNDMAAIRPAWLEIDLDNLHANIDAVRRQAPRAQLLAAVKANAYGQGLLEVSREFNTKADFFGVAFLQEGIALRQAGITKSILIFGPGQPAEASAIVQGDMDQTITTWEMAASLAAAAAAAGRSANVHVKVDTGMGRLGLMPADVPAFITRLAELPSLRLRGIYSHFPGNLANFPDFTRKQFAQFMALLNDLQTHGHRIPLRHIASSSTIFQLPESQLDMVRPGGCLYGFSAADHSQPVMTLKARVSHVRILPADTFISYRLTYRTTQQTRIAVLPLGYADGLPRALSNRGHALIRGQKFPIVGVICMDQAMVNVGNATVEPGDEAVLIGRQADQEININSMVDMIDGTSSNEIACQMSQRLPRVYMREGRIAYINHGYLPLAN